MNKTQFVDAIAREVGITKIEARKVIDASIRVAIDTFRNGDGLVLSSFGTFSVAQKPPRMGRNPRTGAPVPISARRVLKFRPTLDLE